MADQHQREIEGLRTLVVNLANEIDMKNLLLMQKEDLLEEKDRLLEAQKYSLREAHIQGHDEFEDDSFIVENDDEEELEDEDRDDAERRKNKRKLVLDEDYDLLWENSVDVPRKPTNNNRHQNVENPDPYYYEDQSCLQNEQLKVCREKELAKKHFKSRTIVHPHFQNIPADEAMETDKETGYSVIRPSSRGPSYLTLTPKVYDDIYADKNIIKDRKDHKDMTSLLRIGKTLKIGEDTFKDLDEQLNHRKFQKGTKAEVDEQLKVEKSERVVVLRHIDESHSTGSVAAMGSSGGGWGGSDDGGWKGSSHRDRTGRFDRVSCKYLHPESDRSNGSGSTGNDNLGTAANPGKSQFYGENRYHDRMSSYFPRKNRSRSPCRRFQDGTCYRGDSFPYLCYEYDAFNRSRNDYNTPLQQGAATTSRYRDFGEAHKGNTLWTSQEHTYVRSKNDVTPPCHRGPLTTSGNPNFGRGRVNMDGDLSSSDFPRQPRRRFPCGNFLSERCDRGASCYYLHPETHGYYSENTSPRSRSPDRQQSRPLGNLGDKTIPEVCPKHSRGRCTLRESCRYLPSLHEDTKSASDCTKLQHSGGMHQRDPSMMREEFDGSFDEKTRGKYADNVENPNITDAKDEVRVGDQQKYADNVENPNTTMQTSQSLLKSTISSPRRKLLVLDVNGLLADIVNVHEVPPGYERGTVIAKKKVFKRPHCDDFLEFCFDRFDVGIWSSRNKIRPTVLKTGYTTIENRDKPLFLKKLKKLWEKQVTDLPWEQGFYDETNTVLLDDSPYKALCNPPYTAIFPYAYKFRDTRDILLGRSGDLRVHLEKLSATDNIPKFIEENPFGQTAITKSNQSWGFYSKIICEQQEGSSNNTPLQ